MWEGSLVIDFPVVYSGADGNECISNSHASLCEEHGKMEQKGNPIQLKARREEEKEVGRPLIHVFKIQTGNKRWFLAFLKTVV